MIETSIFFGNSQFKLFLDDSTNQPSHDWFASCSSKVLTPTFARDGKGKTVGLPSLKQRGQFVEINLYTKWPADVSCLAQMTCRKKLGLTCLMLECQLPTREINAIWMIIIRLVLVRWRNNLNSRPTMHTVYFPINSTIMHHIIICIKLAPARSIIC